MESFTNEDWLNLREFDAFKLIRNEEWNYSDFDVWLSIRDTHLYTLGGDSVHKAIIEMQKIVGIRP